MKLPHYSTTLTTISIGYTPRVTTQNWLISSIALKSRLITYLLLANLIGQFKLVIVQTILAYEGRGHYYRKIYREFPHSYWVVRIEKTHYTKDAHSPVATPNSVSFSSTSSIPRRAASSVDKKRR